MNPMRTRSGWLLALVVGLAPAGLAQTPQQQDEPAGQEGPQAQGAFVDAEGLMRAWRAEHGAPWKVRMSRETGRARMVFGGTASATSLPRTDAELFAATRELATQAAPLFGVDTRTLVEDRVLPLPLAAVGSSDKLSVQLHQEVNGVRVRRGWVNALYDTSGQLLAMDVTALPEMEAFETTPTVAADEATRFAIATFRATTGVQPTRVGEALLRIHKAETAKDAVEPTLVWEIELMFRGTNQDIEGYRYLIAARGAARVVAREDLVHRFDVGGTVMSHATPGTLPDEPGNEPLPVPMAYMTVTSSAGTTTTDANGTFNFPGATGPLDVTFSYEGTYNDVIHAIGSDYSLTVPLTGTGNVVSMNSSPTEHVTAQANAFYHINQLRDWTRAINPADGMMDFVNTAYVNYDFLDVGQIFENCNALYTGSETNYFIEDGGCVNTAFSTVISHEQGHWQNERYGSGNGSDGFGEGNADVFSMYVNDTPIVGEDFFFSGEIRSGLNTTPYCGDGNGGCHGGVHANGQVLMGALWKVRANLNATHGDATGDLIADSLFSAWMNGYNQGTIDSIIEVQWLTLDDDDGNIDNGTPNFGDIDDGFLAQGFPGYEFVPMSLSSPIEPNDTLDEAGPYGVAADITSNVGEAITSASLFYQVNGGATFEIPMTHVSGDTWKALLPGVPSPARVSYHVEATDSNANTQPFPGSAFTVGELQQFLAEDFESVDDAGWTHDLVTNQDDWQHGAPQGKSGTSSGVAWSDPASAASGSQVWGNDLGPSGWNGSYMPNTENFLSSPPIDLSSAVGTTLRFQRWLTVEEGIFDQAEIVVNGTQVWANPLNDHVLDTEWTEMELDISAAADGNPATVLEWRLTSDGGLQLGGWNLDDVELFTLDPSPTSGLPVNYGAGLAGTNGVPVIDTAGQPATLGNDDHVVAIKNGLPGSTCYVLLGTAPLDVFVPVLQTNLLVQPLEGASTNLDLFGQAFFSFPIPADMAFAGLSFYFQGFFVDAGSVGPFALTDGLQVTIVN